MNRADTGLIEPKKPMMAPFSFAGHSFVADHSGALHWPAQKLLVVSDLHLEKASFYAVHGQFLPPYDTDETLARLEAAVARYQPRRLLMLGDSLHDAGAGDRVGEADRARLAALCADLECLWICGNHDPQIPAMLGTGLEQIDIAGIRFVHEASGRRGPEISGHFHPKAKIQGRGGVARGRCFVWRDDRLILPAFGAFTGGLDITSPAIRAHVGPRPSLLLIGRRRLHRR